jgi:hypothetical protein
MNLQEDWPLLLAGAAVVGAFALSAHGSVSSDQVAGAQGYQVVPAAGIDPTAVSIAQGNLAEAQQYEQGLFAAFGGLEQATVSQHNADNTLALEAMNEQTQLELQRLRNGAAVTAGNTQVAVTQAQLAQQQSQFDALLHQQQQSALWNGIFSLGGSLATMLPGLLPKGGAPIPTMPDGTVLA